MTTPFLLALTLLTPGAANADPVLQAAAAESGAIVAETRAAQRQVVCVVDAQLPIKAVRQIGRLKPDQRYPVDIRQINPNRVEIRAQARPLGASFTGSPLAAKLAGILIAQPSADGQWLVGFVFSEAASGARRVDVWQIAYSGDAPHTGFELDLSGSKPGEFHAVIPSKGSSVSLKAYCALAAKD